MDIKGIAKAMGNLAASLAEATEAELGALLLVKDNHVGVFVGSESNMDADKTVRHLRRIASHLNTLADSIVSGKTKCDGVAYGMSDDGTVTQLGDKDQNKPSSGDADISLIS